MTRHAMAYVQMAHLVRNEIDRTSDYEVGGRLGRAADELVAAESALARAYGSWRSAMQAAGDAGNARAQVYLKRTQWDLT